MSLLIVKTLKFLFPKFAATGLLTYTTLLGVLSPAQADVITPAYTTTGSTGAYYNASVAASFGFFFDTDVNVKVNALGFSSQVGWDTGSSPYDVSLWSYTNGGNVKGDYTLLATRTFTPGLPSYYFQNGYFWQNIPQVALNDSTTGDPTGQIGFVIGVEGDFSNLPGNVQYEGGTPNFLLGFANGGNGYNDLNIDPTPLAPDLRPIPAYFDAAVGSTGFFNGNFSVLPVPGPLPLLGAAAAFSLSRRIRKRVNSASK